MYTTIKLILYYFGYQLGFSAIAMFVSKLVPMDMVTMTSLAMVASTLTMSWHLLRYGYVDLIHDRYKTLTPVIMGISVVFVFAAMYVLNLLIEQIGIPNTMEETFLAMSRNPFGILSITLLAPVLEELLFRGAIQKGLLLRYKPWTAILTSSLLFGVVHLNPAQIPFAFILGLMFGWLYYRTGSLLPGIVGHVLNNTVATVNMYLYGTTTIEEQMQNSTVMWLWGLAALAALVTTALWLDRKLKDQPSKCNDKN